jgi:hypothetical protein
VQSAPQLIPTPVTVPVPVPALFTVNVEGGGVNAAVTFVAAVIVTMQVPVPTQPPPDHPVNVDPFAGAAVNVTSVS